MEREQRELEDSYRSKFEDSVFQELSKCNGLFKNIYLRIFSDSHFHKDDKAFNFASPYWHIKYIEPRIDLSTYIDRVFNICRLDITMELYGLSFLDLLELDLPTFERLEREIVAIRDERIKNKNDIEKEGSKIT